MLVERIAHWGRSDRSGSVELVECTRLVGSGTQLRRSIRASRMNRRLSRKIHASLWNHVIPWSRVNQMNRVTLTSRSNHVSRWSPPIRWSLTSRSNRGDRGQMLSQLHTG